MKNLFKLTLCTALLLFPSVSWADNYLVIINGKLVEAEAIVQPTAKIIGNETPVELGGFAEVKVEITDSAKSFIKGTKTSWKITQNGQPKRYFISQDGNPVIPAGITNGVQIDLEANTEITYGIEDKTVLKSILSKGVLNVGQNVDPPKPPPAPNPDPTPIPVVVPDGFNGATRATYDIFKKDALPSLAQFSKDDISAAKKALKDNFDNVATRISAGTIQGANLEEFLKKSFDEIKTLNNADVSISKVKSGLINYNLSLQKYINTNFYANDKLKTTGDWADLFRAIGEGFKYE